MNSELTLAVLALPNRTWDVAGNLERLRTWVTRAAEQGADLVIAPEAYLDGYCLTDLEKATAEETMGRYPEVAHQWPDAPSLSELADHTRGAGVHLICGGIEREGERAHGLLLRTSGADRALP
jgi:predicted amidohydrolase